MWHLCILKNDSAKKLDQTSKKGNFVGNSDNSKYYLVGFEDEKGKLKIQKSRNVSFNENEFYFKHKKTQKLVEDIDNGLKEVSIRYRSFASKKC